MQTTQNQSRSRQRTTKLNEEKMTDSSQPGSIYELLMADHQKVKALLEKIEDTEDIKEAKELFKEVHSELKAHSEAEQKAFYDKLKSDENSKDMIFEAEEEHAIVSNLMKEASQTRNAERFMAKMKVLKDLVEHHVKEEENEIFPSSKNYVDDVDAEEMGKKFQKLKDRFLTLN